MINKEITILIVAYKSDSILLRNLSYLKNFKVIIIDNFKDSNLNEKIASFTNINYIIFKSLRKTGQFGQNKSNHAFVII